MTSKTIDLVGLMLGQKFLPERSTFHAECNVSEPIFNDERYGARFVRETLARQISDVIGDSPDLLHVKRGEFDLRTRMAKCATEVVVMTPQQVRDLCRQCYEAGQQGWTPWRNAP